MEINLSIGIFSFFSGVGLLDLGFENSGYDILEVFEKKESFLNMYKYSREQMNYKKPKYGYNLEDVEELLENNDFIEHVKNENKKRIIGFIGGPPCPDFSIAGKNKGADGENGRLSSVYFELIKKSNPTFFLFENVKGIWKTQKNNKYIKKEMEKMENSGYLLDFDILNSLDFGVPQDRERFFIFGVKKDFLAINQKNISNFFKDGFIKKFEKKRYNWPTIDNFQEAAKKAAPKDIEESLTIQYWFKKNDVYNHENSNEYFQPRAFKKFETIAEGDITKKSFKRLHRWRYSPTAAYGNNEVHLHPYYKRRLSISEVLSIQSAPKDFVLPHEISLTDKFKVVGNAVPYLMALEIAKKIKTFLEEEI